MSKEVCVSQNGTCQSAGHIHFHPSATNPAISIKTEFSTRKSNKRATKTMEINAIPKRQIAQNENPFQHRKPVSTYKS